MLMMHKTMLIQKIGVSDGIAAGSSGKMIRDTDAADPSKPINVPCGRPPRSLENAATTTAVVIGQPMLHTKSSATPRRRNVSSDGAITSMMLPIVSIVKPNWTQLTSVILWRKYSIEKYEMRPSKPR
ncbi:TPA: hypothetical protein N0F65_008328 [Lagenidium giganteum]|uniref:Uncharacterized protein n=1 Tax=Lagenidium giganteum TaxID=4803 RepID=A0AAV2YQM8_9STRA|nr:TPA: hypothetical protein N0F65_008328 [Lagenidium giganteum]